MNSTDSDDKFYYIYDDESLKISPKKQKSHESTTQDFRKDLFNNILWRQHEVIFSLPGLHFLKFTHLKIKLSFQPNLIYEGISSRYIFYCSLKYLKKYQKWIVKREPMPARPLYRRVTRGSVFIRDNIEDLNQVICGIYYELKKWSKNEIRTRHNKYENYKAGLISYIELDSTDEEFFLSDEERKELHEKRISVLRRMIPPLRK